MKSCPDEAHTNTRKINLDISTITDVFLNQKKVNLCEHTAKLEPRECFVKVCETEIGSNGRGWGKIECKSTKINTRAVSRRKNKFIGEFKMVAGDVVSIRGRVWSARPYQRGLKGSWWDSIRIASGRVKLSWLLEEDNLPHRMIQYDCRWVGGWDCWVSKWHGRG